MSQVNLLPPEIRQGQALRRTTAIVAGVGAAVLVLIGLLYFVQTIRLANAQDELAAQQATNGSLQQQIAELQPYADQQAQLQTKQQLAATVYVNEVSWSSLLLDVSRIIPDDAYLTAFNGLLSASTGTTIGAPATGADLNALIGNLSFQGEADGTETIASWLTRLEQVKGWVNAWVNSAQETGEFSGIYTFDSGVDLSGEAATPRGQGKGKP